MKNKDLNFIYVKEKLNYKSIKKRTPPLPPLSCWALLSPLVSNSR